MNTTSLPRRLLLTALTLLTLSAAQAQHFPSKPVALMVPYPAGGLSDVIARMVNVPLGKHLQQPVIVENVGGVSGAIAAQKVLSAPSDGYYLFQGSPNELILSPLANAAVKFKSEDFRLVQAVGAAQIAFLARKDIPANSVDEFIDYARKMAKEGKPITYASVGPGSFYHLLGEHLSKVTGIEMTHVPYKGSGQAIADVLAGQVQVFITTPPSVMQHVQAGKLKALAVTGKTRHPQMPQVPTVAEAGGPADFEVRSWIAMYAPAGVPSDVIAKISQEVQKSLQQPALRERLREVFTRLIQLDAVQRRITPDGRG